jgi:hypothetical protein
MSYTNSALVLVADPFARAANGQSPFAGVPQATLQQWLNEATTALHTLLTGNKPVVVSYGMGDGQKSVSYQRTDEAKLRRHCDELRVLLGQGGRRRPIRLAF